MEHDVFFPDYQTVPDMLRRYHFILNSIPVQRIAQHSGIPVEEVQKLVYLRIVRECNLPDSYIVVLKVNLSFYNAPKGNTSVAPNAPCLRDYFLAIVLWH